MKTKRFLAIFLTIFAVIFAAAGFVVPPVGVINSSVLWLIAQFFIYAATLLGIDIEYIKLFRKN